MTPVGGFKAKVNIEDATSRGDTFRGSTSTKIMKFHFDPRSRRVTKSGFRCAIWMVQHRIFIKKTVDVCKKVPEQESARTNVMGRSGQGLDFCHWSLKILIFWYRPFAKLFQPLSILSDPKQIGNISLDVCKKLLRHVRAQSSVRVFPGACSLGRGPGAAEEEEAEEAAEEGAEEAAEEGAEEEAEEEAEEAAEEAEEEAEEGAEEEAQEGA